MGATLGHIQQKGFLHKDEELAKIYKKIKELLDEYHRAFIADTLGDAQLVGLDEFYADYQALKQDSKNSHLKDKLTKTQDNLRKQITKNFEKTPQLKERYKRLFTKELFKAGKDKGDLEKWLINHDSEPNKAEKISWIHQFENFTTYFQGFYENRKNMYSDEAKHTAIAYRLIHENLPRFVDNIQVLSKIKSDYPDLYQELNHLDSRTIDFADFNFDDVLQMDFYHHLLIQSGITAYNTLLGGKVLEGGKKLQGINELINLYGQKHKVKIAKLKPLHKQILSDGQSVSFLPKKFDDDYELCQTVNHFYREYVDIFDEVVVLFQKFYDYDKDNIYINHQQLNQLSHELFADFRLLSYALDFYYCQIIDGDFNDKINNAKSQNAKEKLLKEKERYTKSNHSINELQKAINHYASHHEDTEVKVISDYFSATNICNMIDGIHHHFSTIKGFLEKDDNQGESYLPKQKNSNDVKNLKVFLDGVLRLIHFIKPLALKSDDTLEKEEHFYGEFMPSYDKLVMFTPLYNKVRDYISQKPYNDEKIKLNFGNSTLLNGWDVNKEKDNFGVILCKEGLYYLAILDKSHKKVFDNAPKATSSHTCQKMVYKLLPGPNKMLPKVFFAKSNIGYYQPSAQLLENYEKGTHKKGSNFSLTDCHHLIDFFKSSIAKHPEWKEFGFENALIKKLNYLVLKNADNHQLGSVRKALQLTNNFTDIKSIGKQTGFIFYVPAWNTSKIDPTTGFVDLLKPRYENMAQAQSFISRFKKIAYNHQLDYFEFEFDYADFYQKTIDKKRIWTLCTYGDVRYYYDHKTKETKTINVTKELKSLLDKHDLSYQNGHNLVDELANSHDKSLLSGVMYLLKVLLALRYSHAQKNEDFILSPVMNKDGVFFDSRFADDALPNNADANGAYHIALKGLWVLNQIQFADNLDKIDLSISNEQWLHFTQRR